MRNNLYKLSSLIAINLFIMACSGQNKEKPSLESESYTVVNDTLLIYKSYYPNKQLNEFIELNREKQINGKCFAWFANGKKKQEWYYFHNRLNGLQLSWDEDGYLDTKRNYKLGNKDGIQINFHKKDTLSYEIYENGILKSRWVPADYYSPPKEMLEGLLSEGLDSTSAIKILRENLSGYIVKKDSKAVFIQDSSITGLIGSTIQQVNQITKTKDNTPITRKYLKSKGLTDKQISYLAEKGFIKLNEANVIKP